MVLLFEGLVIRVIRVISRLYYGYRMVMAIMVRSRVIESLCWRVVEMMLV